MIYEGKKQFKCDICNAEFKSKYSMNVYIAILYDGRNNTNLTFAMLILYERVV